MARHTRDIKAAKQNQMQRYEHSEVFDDNLLPDAIEIEKLSHIDPHILDWLKIRAEKEQDFRHDAYKGRLKLVDTHNCRDHNTSRFALAIYLLLVGGCIVASYFLLIMGKGVSGSMFGGAAVILALAVLITRRQAKSPEDQDSKSKNA